MLVKKLYFLLTNYFSTNSLLTKMNKKFAVFQELKNSVHCTLLDLYFTLYESTHLRNNIQKYQFQLFIHYQFHEKLNLKLCDKIHFLFDFRTLCLKKNRFYH